MATFSRAERRAAPWATKRPTSWTSPATKRPTSWTSPARVPSRDRPRYSEDEGLS